MRRALFNRFDTFGEADKVCTQAKSFVSEQSDAFDDKVVISELGDLELLL